MWDCAEGRCLMSELHMGSERPLIGVSRHMGPVPVLLFRAEPACYVSGIQSHVGASPAA